MSRALTREEREDRYKAWLEAEAKGYTKSDFARHIGITPSRFRSWLSTFLESGGLREEEELEPMPDVPPPAPRDVHDAAFWRKRARDLERELGEADSIIRELGSLDGATINPENWNSLEQAPDTGRAFLIVHNSDRHFGEVVEPKEINGWNEYNPDICRDRVRRFIGAACELGQRWIADSPCDGVLYTMCGDEISGDIHEELRETNAMTSLLQVEGAAGLHCECITRLVEVYGRVHVAAVPGNHGRTTKKPSAKKYGDLSYDTMIARIVARHFADDDRISFDIAAGSDVFIVAYGRRILVTHGDKMGTGGGQGFAGPELPILRGAHKTRAQYASAGMPIDAILMGHFHTSANLRGVLANGSVVGASEYGCAIRAPLDDPKQWLGVYRSRWGLSEVLAVRLGSKPEPTKPRIRIKG